MNVWSIETYKCINTYKYINTVWHLNFHLLIIIIFIIYYILFGHREHVVRAPGISCSSEQCAERWRTAPRHRRRMFEQHVLVVQQYVLGVRTASSWSMDSTRIHEYINKQSIPTYKKIQIIYTFQNSKCFSGTRNTICVFCFCWGATNHKTSPQNHFFL